MQRPFFLLCALSIALAPFAGCEKHSWDDTKKLHQPHGEHAHDHGDEKGGAHDEKKSDKAH